jgi:hypothetical protein
MPAITANQPTRRERCSLEWTKPPSKPTVRGQVRAGELRRSGSAALDERPLLGAEFVLQALGHGVHLLAEYGEVQATAEGKDLIGPRH